MAVIVVQPPWAAARLFILRDSQESNISRRRRGTFYRRNKVGGRSVSEEVRLQYRADNQSVDCWLRELNYNSIIFDSLTCQYRYRRKQ